MIAEEAAVLEVSTSRRWFLLMNPAKRATIYFEPALHRALRLKAASSDRSISDMVNEAVRLSLAEDAEDLEAFVESRSEPNLDFEAVVEDQKTLEPAGA